MYLGKLGYGSAAAPPSDVLAGDSNQNQANPTVVNNSAFVQGKLVLRYTKGTLPLDSVTLGTDNVFGAATSASAIFNVGGQWTTSNSGGNGVAITLQPGSTTDIPIWVEFPEVRTNSHPTIPQADLNKMAFGLVPLVSQIGGNSASGGNGTYTVTGPAAAECGNGDHQLLPFAKLPTDTCRHGSGATAAG